MRNINLFFIFFPEFLLFIVTLFYFILFFFSKLNATSELEIFSKIYFFFKNLGFVDLDKDSFLHRLYVCIGLFSFIIMLFFIINNYFVLDLLDDGGITYWYLSVSTFSLIFKFFIVVFSFFIFSILLFFSNDPYFKEVIDFKTFYLLFFLILNGIFWSLCVDHLLLLFLCLEIQSLGYYIISGIKRESFSIVNSSIHFFFISVFFSCIFLVSLIGIYKTIGSFDFYDILVYCQSNTTLSLGTPVLLYKDVPHSFDNYFIWSAFFCLFAIFFKLGGVPFHFWMVNLYTNTHLVAFLLFYILPKFAYFFVCFKLICIFHPVFFTVTGHHFYFFFFYMTFCTGIAYCYIEISVRKVLAYSAVMNLGFFMLSAVSLNIIQGIVVCLIYFICYAFTSFSFIITYSIFNSLELKEHMRQIYFYDFARLVLLNPLLGINLLFCYLSLAGIPPLGGFIAKYYVISHLSSSTEIGFSCGLYLTILAVCGAVIYVRGINYLFITVRLYGIKYIMSTSWKQAKYPHFGYILLLIICFICVFLFTFYFSFFESHILLAVKKFLNFLFGGGF